jgi:mono/diheme cytochrome c family protein
LIAVALFVGACQQEMSKQPYYRPLEKSSFFADGRSARPIPAGTVPRGRPLSGSPLSSGQVPGHADDVVAAQIPPAQRMQFVGEFPFQMTVTDLSRGRERFEIFCAMCHDPLGTGHGKIVERGYLEPPSYLTDNSRGFERVGIRKSLREVPVGYLFHVITEGFGGMPAYRSQIPPADRWRIAAYIRVLQFSQNVSLGSLAATEQDEVRQRLERK